MKIKRWCHLQVLYGNKKLLILTKEINFMTLATVGAETSEASFASDSTFNDEKLEWKTLKAYKLTLIDYR